MARSDNCKRQAEKCEQLAIVAYDSNTASLYRELAHKWRTIAEKLDYLDTHKIDAIIARN